MMRTVWQLGASVLAFLTATALTGAAAAQDQPAPAPPAAPEPAPAQAQAQAEGSAQAGGQFQLGGGGGGTAQTGGGAGMALPGAAPAAPAAAVAGNSDHDQMVGSLAVGYLGRRTLQVGDSTVAGNQGTVEAPVVGVRYWIDEAIGIDAGLGFGYQTATASTTIAGTPSIDAQLPTTTGFLIHGGVPLSLTSSGHFSFQLIPELNVGFSSFSQNGPPGTPGDLSGSGFHLDVGARVGAEIHFGFIGIPQLSLQGSIGLAFQTDSWKSDDESVTPNVSNEGTSTGFATSVQDNPWNIFRSNVAALYYF